MRELHQQSVGNALVSDFLKKGEEESARVSSVLEGSLPITDDVRENMITVVFRIMSQHHDVLSTEHITVEFSENAHQLRLHPVPDVREHRWKWQVGSIGICAYSTGGEVEPAGVCPLGNLQPNVYIFRAEIQKTMRDFLQQRRTK